MIYHSWFILKAVSQTVENKHFIAEALIQEKTDSRKQQQNQPTSTSKIIPSCESNKTSHEIHLKLLSPKDSITHRET